MIYETQEKSQTVHQSEFYWLTSLHIKKHSKQKEVKLKPIGGRDMSIS